jgi:hypothetical protein
MERGDRLIADSADRKDLAHLCQNSLNIPILQVDKGRRLGERGIFPNQCYGMAAL